MRAIAASISKSTFSIRYIAIVITTFTIEGINSGRADAMPVANDKIICVADSMRRGRLSIIICPIWLTSSIIIGAIVGTAVKMLSYNEDSIDIVLTEMIENEKLRSCVFDDKEFISLTDLARYADEDDPRYPIQNWMRNKDVISYLGLWESIHNENFKGVEFDTFKNEAGSNKFKISPQKWIRETNAIGMISKSGNNGGTYARSDIALEFASWLSPEFKLYLITEFERLKTNEAYQEKIDWQANRLLSKLNYIVHTERFFALLRMTEQNVQNDKQN